MQKKKKKGGGGEWDQIACKIKPYWVKVSSAYMMTVVESIIQTSSELVLTQNVYGYAGNMDILISGKAEILIIMYGYAQICMAMH